MNPIRQKSHLAVLNDRYREGLDQIGSLLGGDPKRPDWDPLDAVDLAVDWVRNGKVDTKRCRREEREIPPIDLGAAE